MSDIVIKAEGLGKKYTISHQAKSRYKTFREQLLHSAQDLFSRTKKLITGQQLTDGDETEEFWALNDVSFEIRQGDRVGIIGRNGAGKSTLLKILSRITEPTVGRVSIKGRVASLLEVGTGFHQELTGRENIYLNGAILGMSRAEIKKKFDAIVDFSGVEKFLDTPVKRYSSGMYVRLAFSVAAHLEPEILIVDEVLAVGDAEFQKKCLGKMEEVSKNEGRTVLFVSHDINAIEKLCSTIIYLKNGFLSEYGEKNDIISKYVRESRKVDNFFNLTLTEGVVLNKIDLFPIDILKGNDLYFEIVITYDVKPNISDLCILIYNSNNIRVAIIDLRPFLDKILYTEKKCNYKGVIKNLNFVEGEYYFGLYYGINGAFNDIFDLSILRVRNVNSENEIKLYKPQYRGFIELNHQPYNEKENN